MESQEQPREHTAPPALLATPTTAPATLNTPFTAPPPAAAASVAPLLWLEMLPRLLEMGGASEGLLLLLLKVVVVVVVAVVVAVAVGDSFCTM